jgi:hypothetical protein
MAYYYSLPGHDKSYAGMRGNNVLEEYLKM